MTPRLEKCIDFKPQVQERPAVCAAVAQGIWKAKAADKAQAPAKAKAKAKAKAAAAHSGFGFSFGFGFELCDVETAFSEPPLMWLREPVSIFVLIFVRIWLVVRTYFLRTSNIAPK